MTASPGSSPKPTPKSAGDPAGTSDASDKDVPHQPKHGASADDSSTSAAKDAVDNAASAAKDAVETVASAAKDAVDTAKEAVGDAAANARQKAAEAKAKASVAAAEAKQRAAEAVDAARAKAAEARDAAKTKLDKSPTEQAPTERAPTEPSVRTSAARSTTADPAARSTTADLAEPVVTQPSMTKTSMTKTPVTKTPVATPPVTAPPADKKPAFTAPPSAPGAVAEPSIGELVSTATNAMSTLVRSEIDLAKLELRSTLKNAGTGVGLFLAAAVVLVFSLTFGFVALAEGINALGLARWLSFLIVFGFQLLVVGLFVVIGIKKVKAVRAPEKTIRTTKETVDYLKTKRG